MTLGRGRVTRAGVYACRPVHEPQSSSAQLRRNFDPDGRSRRTRGEMLVARGEWGDDTEAAADIADTNSYVISPKGY